MTVPQPFEVLLVLQSPFYYNPSSGNLLLDIRSFSGGTTGPLDATDVLGDSVSIVSTGPANAVTGFAGTDGLVTRFTIISVPEPGVQSLVTIGGALVAFALRRAQREGR